ncbi:RDD family protein [Leptolyngbya sp. AN02str]|uniref:RDD family protein n=1 Tax=Leptolyngbya sp. AN02str TaxID=3423363 RepID=UPI003D31B4DB
MRFFNRVTVPTPESTELDFSLAGIGNRALALVIDYLILLTVLMTFWIVWLLISIQLLSYLSEVSSPWASGLINWLLAIALLLNFVISLGYFVFFEVKWRGQTPGKRFAHIRVIRENGTPVGLSQAALRALLRPIDDSFFIGALFILLSAKEKRIGDMLAGTIVVQTQPSGNRAAIATSDTANQLASQLPQLTQLANLSPDDFGVVREYLRRRKTLATKARTELSMNLARQIRDRIQLETIPPDLTSDDFLEAVYMAYQAQNQH